MLKTLSIIYNQKTSIKQIEETTYQPKPFENPSIVDIKSIITEHPKTWYKIMQDCKTSWKNRF